MSHRNAPLLGFQDLVAGELHRIGAQDEGGVASYILGPPQLVRARRIQVSAIPQRIEVRRLHRVKGAAVRAVMNALARTVRGSGECHQVFVVEFLDPLYPLVRIPRQCEPSPKGDGKRISDEQTAGGIRVSTRIRIWEGLS